MQFNADAPDIIGIETPLYAVRQALLNAPTKAIGMLLEPGSVSANELHRFLLDVAGQPGLALEIVNNPVPGYTSQTFYPGSDSDAVTTGFADSAGGAVNFGDVDDRYDTANYARNSSKVYSGTTYPLLFCSNNAGALNNRRVLAVHVSASAILRRISGNPSSAYLAPALSIDTVNYYGAERSFGKTDRPTFFDRLGTWYSDPSTGLPWVTADVDDFLDPTDNELYGVRLRGAVASQGARIPGFVLEVEHAPENRMWFAYLNQQPQRGWHEQAMTSLLGAMSANTWYWLIISCPFATAASWAKVPILVGDLVTPLSPDAASSAGEVRRYAEITLGWPAGITLASPDPKPGFIPALVGNSSTINSISQPYASLDAVYVYSGGIANIGQQLYSPAGGPHAVAGIGVELTWIGTDRPDAPLIFEVRSGAGAISGGGSLLATATLDSAKLPRSGAQFVRVPFDGGGVNLASSTQYHVLVRSSASLAHAWVLFRADTRSDFLQAAPTTTLAEIEQQSFGRAGGTGQDDAYCENGSTFGRYDLIIQILKAPTAPTGFAATLVPAKTIPRQSQDRCDPTVIEPRIFLSWNQTVLSTKFAAYIVERRLRATPAPAWEPVYERRVQPGETPATVEASETLFIDSTAGWAVTDTPNADGWDYRLMVEDTTGLRSLQAAQVLVGVSPVAIDDSWMVSNAAWWLRAPIRVLTEVQGGGADALEVWQPLGREGAVIRTPIHVPVRRYKLSWSDLDYGSEARLAAVREAATSGRKMALLQSGGDRLLGAPTVAERRRNADRRTDYACDFVLAGRPVSEAVVGGFNGPCEVLFNGSSGYALTASDASLNPGSGAFAVAIAARISGTNSKYLISKGNLGTSDGYALRTTAVANVVEAVVDGASGAVTCSAAMADLFTGLMHVWWLVWDGNRLSIYVDDETVARATNTGAPGAVTNSVGLAVAANNAGASGWAAHIVRAWGYWPAVPTEAQRKATSLYMLGAYGQAVQPGGSLFIDLADDRTWGASQVGLRSIAGAVTELSAALAGGWSRRGSPAPLWRRERWYAH